MSVVAAAQSGSSFLPTRGGMARLSRHNAIVFKFPAHMNYAVTRVSTGIRTQHRPATNPARPTAPSRLVGYQQEKPTNCGTKAADLLANVFFVGKR